MEHYYIYNDGIPDFLEGFLELPVLQRLKQVGMHCGCEYTSLPVYRNSQPYSRYDHSVGAALIIWRFTRSMPQTIAGLLHDIATPVFAHTVDFMNRDYMKQESTEEGTAELIYGDGKLLGLLEEISVTPAEVCDYHQYPVADNDSPKLSADRLEYSFGNMLSYNYCAPDTVIQLYSDLTVGRNEAGEDELMFRTADAAERFSRLALRCSRVYVSDEDRYAMQLLSELLRSALDSGVINQSDLHATEPAVIAKIKNSGLRGQWERYCRLSGVIRSGTPDGSWRRVDAKKRFINPLVEGGGRIAELSAVYKAELTSFTSEKYDYSICGTVE